MQRAFKTQLKLNNRQKTLMAQHAGYSRWVGNWALAMWNEAYKQGLKPSTNKLKKFYTNHIKPQYSWQSTLSSRVYQFAFMHLGEAFSRFFQGVAEHPKFKKKGKNDSFTLDNCGKVMKFSGKRLKLPFIGWVNTYEPLPKIQTKRITISRVADSWYISVGYDFEPEQTVKSREYLGVDVGVKVLAACSDGTVFDNPAAHKKAQKNLARLQRELSGKQKGSNNRNKARLKLANAHQKVANIRKDAIHKLTSWLCKNHAVIGLEDLNVSGMLKNHKLAGAIADSALSEIRRQVEYKSEWYGLVVVFADRFYPSTKTCSSCGHVQEMPLTERVCNCKNCGVRVDRDLNASLNLLHYAEGFSVNCLSYDRVLPTVRGDAAQTRDLRSDPAPPAGESRMPANRGGFRRSRSVPSGVERKLRSWWFPSRRKFARERSLQERECRPTEVVSIKERKLAAWRNSREQSL